MKSRLILALFIITSTVVMADSKKEKTIFLDEFNSSESIPNPKVWKLAEYLNVAWARHFKNVNEYENVKVETGYLKLKASTYDKGVWQEYPSRSKGKVNQTGSRFIPCYLADANWRRNLA